MYVLGFDVGGTKIAICLAEVTFVDGKHACSIIASERIPGGSKQKPDSGVPQMNKVGNRLLLENLPPGETLHAVGVCVPGQIDLGKGTMTLSPNMQAWHDYPLVDKLRENFKVKVKFDNDANGAVVAEKCFGSAQRLENVVYLSMSTGVGGGILANGSVVRGESVLGGELGHLILDVNGPKCNCGMTGCFEAFCGGKRFEERAQEAAKDNPDHPFWKIEGVKKLEDICIRLIRDAAFSGCAESEKWWDEFCLRLAQGIGLCLMTFNPQMAILGTIAMHSGNMLFDKVNEYLPRFAWDKCIRDCQIVPSKLGAQIGELAGIAIAIMD